MTGITLNAIKKVGLDQWKGRKNWLGKTVTIWSREHLAWWREDGRGYTRDPFEASRYSFEEAFKRTKHCGPEKKIVFYQWKKF